MYNREEIVTLTRMICSIIGGGLIAVAFQNMYLGIGIVFIIWTIDK